MENGSVGYGYVAIGEKADRAKETDDEIAWSFKTIADAKRFIDGFDVLLELHADFIKEVANYVDNQKFIVISDSGVVETFSNGGKKQEILFKDDKNLFKISILSESVVAQSFANLLIKDSGGWSTLWNANPQRDYNIDLAYTKQYGQDSFNRIIEDFQSIAERI